RSREHPAAKSGNATSALHLASPLPLLLLGDAIRVHSERALRLHRNRDAEQGLEPRRRTDETPPSPPLLCERGGYDEMNVYRHCQGGPTHGDHGDSTHNGRNERYWTGDSQ